MRKLGIACGFLAGWATRGAVIGASIWLTIETLASTSGTTFMLCAGAVCP
jgi:hypothetical protein